MLELNKGSALSAQPRNELGQLMPGAVIAPNGCKGNQIFSKAALNKMFDEMLTDYTLEKILELDADPMKKGKLSTAKAMVLARIIDSLQKGGGHDFDRILDRAHGKVSNPESEKAGGVTVIINRFSDDTQVTIDGQSITE